MALRPRIIPCLLLLDGGLVKTAQFSKPKYVGDPINAVRIFNEKEVDELMVLDIMATKFKCAPNYELISKLARECRMPLCYGGGVADLDQFERIVGLGVEKVAMSSIIMNNPNFISDCASKFGSQSVVVVFDVKKRGLLKPSYEIYTHNAKKKTGIDPIQFSRELKGLGAGELILNSIDNDGMMTGYDISLADKILNDIDLPVTILGGAKDLADIKNIIQRYKIVGAGAGSLFVFQGKYRAVLIQYPNQVEKDALLG